MIPPSAWLLLSCTLLKFSSATVGSPTPVPTFQATPLITQYENMFIMKTTLKKFTGIDEPIDLQVCLTPPASLQIDPHQQIGYMFYVEPPVVDVTTVGNSMSPECRGGGIFGDPGGTDNGCDICAANEESISNETIRQYVDFYCNGGVNNTSSPRPSLGRMLDIMARTMRDGGETCYDVRADPLTDTSWVDVSPGVEGVNNTCYSHKEMSTSHEYMFHLRVSPLKFSLSSTLGSVGNLSVGDVSVMADDLLQTIDLTFTDDVQVTNDSVMNHLVDTAIVMDHHKVHAAFHRPSQLDVKISPTYHRATKLYDVAGTVHYNISAFDVYEHHNATANSTLSVWLQNITVQRRHTDDPSRVQCQLDESLPGKVICEPLSANKVLRCSPSFQYTNLTEECTNLTVTLRASACVETTTDGYSNATCDTVRFSNSAVNTDATLVDYYSFRLILATDAPITVTVAMKPALHYFRTSTLPFDVINRDGSLELNSSVADAWDARINECFNFSSSNRSVNEVFANAYGDRKCDHLWDSAPSADSPVVCVGMSLPTSDAPTWPSGRNYTAKQGTSPGSSRGLVYYGIDGDAAAMEYKVDYAITLHNLRLCEVTASSAYTDCDMQSFPPYFNHTVVETCTGAEGVGNASKCVPLYNNVDSSGSDRSFAVPYANDYSCFKESDIEEYVMSRLRGLDRDQRLEVLNASNYHNLKWRVSFNVSVVTTSSGGGSSRRRLLNSVAEGIINENATSNTTYVDDMVIYVDDMWNENVEYKIFTPMTGEGNDTNNNNNNTNNNNTNGELNHSPLEFPRLDLIRAIIPQYSTSKEELLKFSLCDMSYVCGSSYSTHSTLTQPRIRESLRATLDYMASGAEEELQYPKAMYEKCANVKCYPNAPRVGVDGTNGTGGTTNGTDNVCVERCKAEFLHTMQVDHCMNTLFVDHQTIFMSSDKTLAPWPNASTWKQIIHMEQCAPCPKNASAGMRHNKSYPCSTHLDQPVFCYPFEVYTIRELRDAHGGLMNMSYCHLPGGGRTAGSGSSGNASNGTTHNVVGRVQFREVDLDPNCSSWKVIVSYLDDASVVHTKVLNQTRTYFGNSSNLVMIDYSQTVKSDITFPLHGYTTLIILLCFISVVPVKKLHSS